ncbi:MAG: hypothetical protein ACXV3F_12035 [Frankiaceae bacterium]
MVVRRPVAPGDAGNPGPGGARSRPARPVRYDADDPATWSNRTLAAQLLMAPARLGDPRAVTNWVRMGLGGVIISGTVPADLGARLGRVRSAAAVRPLVTSNEEGGSVQRLTKLISPCRAPPKWGGCSHQSASGGRRRITAGG